MSSKGFDWLVFTLGFIAGCAFMPVIVFFPKFIGNIDNNINWFGVFVGALVASGAGIATVWAIIRQTSRSVDTVQQQIDEATRLENDRNERRFLAAKAVLLLPLASICEYCRLCTKTLLEANSDTELPEINEKDEEPISVLLNTKLPFPIVPEKEVIIETFKECIEHGLDDERLFEMIKVLIRRFQVIRSRMSGIWNDPTGNYMNVDYYYGTLADIVETYARASKLIQYVNPDANNIEDLALHYNDIESAARILGFWGERWSTFHLRLRSDYQ